MNKTKETETSAAISKHFDRMYLYLDIFHLENRINLLKKPSQIRWVKFKSLKIVVIEQLWEFWHGHGMQVPNKCPIKKWIWYWEMIHMLNTFLSEALASLRHNSFIHFHAFPLTSSKTIYIKKLHALPVHKPLR